MSVFHTQKLGKRHKELADAVARWIAFYFGSQERPGNCILSELALAPAPEGKPDAEARLTALVLNGVTSVNSRRLRGGPASVFRLRAESVRSR